MTTSLSETAARALDAALRAKADEMDALARSMDDKTADPAGFHPNTLQWFADTAPILRADAAALRLVGRRHLRAALE